MLQNMMYTITVLWILIQILKMMSRKIHVFTINSILLYGRVGLCDNYVIYDLYFPFFCIVLIVVYDLDVIYFRLSFISFDKHSGMDGILFKFIDESTGNITKEGDIMPTVLTVSVIFGFRPKSCKMSESKTQVKRLIYVVPLPKHDDFICMG